MLVLKRLPNLARALIILILLSPMPVFALSQDELNSIDSDTVWYAISGGGGGGCSELGVGGGGLDQFLRALIVKEGTNGSPTAHTPGSSAYGKYQYFDQTWQDQISAYYPPAALQYQHASDAPEAVQDAVTYLEYSVQSVRQNGSVLRMAINHYQPSALTDLAALNSTPSGNSLTPREYGNELVNDFNGGSGSQFQLLYSQAPDFATYAAKAGKPAALWTQTLDSATELPPLNPPDGTNTVTGASSTCGIPASSFVFYDQADSQWASYKYGDSTIAYVGCGPTAVAMAVATLADSSVTPKQTADYGNSHNGYTPGIGSNSNMLVGGPENWGLKVQSIATDMNSAIAVLKGGGLVIAGGTSPGGVNVPPFSKDGHVVVLRGLDSNGNFLIGNPAPGLQTNQDESFSSSELLAAGLQYMYGVTK